MQIEGLYITTKNENAKHCLMISTHLFIIFFKTPVSDLWDIFVNIK